MCDGDSELKISSLSTFANCPLDTVYLGRNLDYTTETYGSTTWYSPFYNTNVKVLICGDEVTTIQTYCFLGCDELVSVDLNKVTAIGVAAFRLCKSLESLVVPNTVKTIGDEAFYYCEGLTSVAFGSGLISIGQYGFRYCTSLTEVVLKGDSLAVGLKAFEGCTGLTDLVVENSVATIGGYCFTSCSNLKTINLGTAENISGYDWSTFKWLTGVESVIVYATTPPVFNDTGDSPFYTYTGTLYVPKGTRDLYASATVWKEFSNIVEMDDYTLTISAACIATLYLPYAVTIPANCKA